MGVRSGYKKTEVGVIPVDWEPIATSELVDPHAPICYGVVQVGRDTNGGVPIVAIKYVKRISSAPLHRSAPALEQPYTRSRVRGGDVLISIKGTIGRIGVVPTGFEGNISRELARLRPREGYSARYIAQQLESDSTQARISRAIVGTTRLEFSIATLRNFEIPVPKLVSEQRAIAASLSDVDAQLDGLERLIAKKHDLKQAAMQQLLTGQTRLSGFRGEWKMKQLGKICSLKSGEGITARNIDDVSPFPCYGGNGLRGFTKRFTHEGDFCLIGRVGALCGNLLKVTGKFFASEHAIVATAFEDVDVGWLSLALGTLNLNTRAESSAQPVLTVSKLLPLEVLAPPTMQEQTAIATVIQDMDAEIATVVQRRKKTRDLKLAMMQELLSGRTRLVP